VKNGNEITEKKRRTVVHQKDALPTLKVVDTPRITATAFVVPTFFRAQLYLMIVSSAS
jgi:hypothetical protein